MFEWKIENFGGKSQFLQKQGFNFGFQIIYKIIDLGFAKDLGNETASSSFAGTHVYAVSIRNGSINHDENLKVEVSFSSDTSFQAHVVKGAGLEGSLANFCPLIIDKFVEPNLLLL